MADVDAGLGDFEVIGSSDADPTPIQQVEQMIIDAGHDMERHARNLKASKELFKRLNATLDAMRAGPGA